jgi:hypothetical protein
VNLFVSELVVIVNAYLLAGVPVAGAWLAGRASPLYQREAGWLVRCWSWFALLIVVSALALRLGATT